MKLYVLNCGQMITPDGNILSQLNTDFLRLVIPVPAFLLVHPEEGPVLIDTGFAYGHLPMEILQNVAWAPSLGLRSQVAALGFDPDGIGKVILSHLHFDHAGQLDDFPNAAVCLREAELRAAFPPSRGDYVIADYANLPERRIERIPDEGDYDFFGDGSLICLDTKGHSPGHQSFLVRLPNTGDVLLTVDAAHLHQYFETDIFYQDAWDVQKAGAAAARLKELSGHCAVTLFGHDPASFKKARKAPEYYD